jgi:hypothetical protein
LLFAIFLGGLALSGETTRLFGEHVEAGGSWADRAPRPGRQLAVAESELVDGMLFGAAAARATDGLGGQDVDGLESRSVMRRFEAVSA